MKQGEIYSTSLHKCWYICIHITGRTITGKTHWQKLRNYFKNVRILNLLKKAALKYLDVSVRCLKAAVKGIKVAVNMLV